MNERVKELVESGLHLIPPHMHEGVRNYYYHGYAPGHFLTAVLTNNLMEALARGDDENVAGLQGWGRFLYNHTPSGSYGSPAAFEAWLSRFADVEA